MKKVRIIATPRRMQAIESSRLLLEYNYNSALHPNEESRIAKTLFEKGECPERKSLSDLVTVVGALSLVDGFIEEIARASWDGRFIDGLTFDPEGNAADKFENLDLREVEIDDSLAEGLLAKAKLLEWSAFPDGPDLEWLINVLVDERHNEAHNAILEFKDTICAMLRKEKIENRTQR